MHVAKKLRLLEGKRPKNGVRYADAEFHGVENGAMIGTM
jgi:hypothetical protein